MQKVTNFIDIFGSKENFKKQQEGTPVSSLLDQDGKVGRPISILSSQTIPTQKGKELTLVDVALDGETFRLTSFDLAAMTKGIEIDPYKMPLTFKLGLVEGKERMVPQEKYERYAYKYEALVHDKDAKGDAVPYNERPFKEGAEENPDMLKNNYILVVE